MEINMTSGIYCIENLVNGKKYIGLSINIEDRWYVHKTTLRGNYHDNSYLQNAWNKYGENNFECWIIEKCGKNKKKCKTTSKYVGVSYDSERDKWRFELTVKEKRIRGRRNTEKEAALAYNEAAIKAYGKNAKLNIIEED